MKSLLGSSMPPRLRRDLAKLGADIAMARKKRHLTTQMMVERVGVARSTYVRVEKGDPTVSLGIYAMTLFVLGFGDVFGQLVDPRNDDQGLLLDMERLPQRVRVKKAPDSR
jgi:DNA-binding XRE family transcriptional regulator